MEFLQFRPGFEVRKIRVKMDGKYFLVVVVFFCLFNSCKKEENYGVEEIMAPQVSTITASSVTQTEATFEGEVTDDGNDPITERGFCWSLDEQPTINDHYSSFGYGTGRYKVKATNLLSGEKYYYRAYAKNKEGESYGEVLSVNTGQKELGDSLGGGILVYIFQPGDNGYVENEFHGIIADFSFITNSIWGCESFSMNTSSGIGTGVSNTTYITNNCFAPSFAAKSCSDYNNNGYSDWVLPSIDDLEQIFVNDNLWNVNFSGNYWSSSQRNGNTAFVIVTSVNNSIGYRNKDDVNRFFPVRYF